MGARGDEVAIGDGPADGNGEVAEGLTHFLLAREGLAATDANRDGNNGSALR